MFLFLGPIIISNNKYVVPVCGKPSIGTEICFLEENDNDDQCVEVTAYFLAHSLLFYSSSQVSIKGRQVFMGYLRDIVATDKVCSKIGHVKTGDSGFQTDVSHSYSCYSDGIYQLINFIVYYCLTGRHNRHHWISERYPSVLVHCITHFHQL